MCCVLSSGQPSVSHAQNSLSRNEPDHQARVNANSRELQIHQLWSTSERMLIRARGPVIMKRDGDPGEDNGVVYWDDTGFRFLVIGVPIISVFLFGLCIWCCCRSHKKDKRIGRARLADMAMETLPRTADSQDSRTIVGWKICISGSIILFLNSYVTA
jgi:hypothetical protein